MFTIHLTCSRLIHYLLMTCLWLITCIQLVTTCSWLVHNLFMNHSFFIHDFLTTSSKYFHDFFTPVGCLAQLSPSLLFCLCLGSLMLYRHGFELQICLRMSPLKRHNISQPSKMFIVKEIMQMSRQHQFLRYKIVHFSLFNILEI